MNNGDEVKLEAATDSGSSAEPVLAESEKKPSGRRTSTGAEKKSDKTNSGAVGSGASKSRASAKKKVEAEPESDKAASDEASQREEHAEVEAPAKKKSTAKKRSSVKKEAETKAEATADGQAIIEESSSLSSPSKKKQSDGTVGESNDFKIISEESEYEADTEDSKAELSVGEQLTTPFAIFGEMDAESTDYKIEAPEDTGENEAFDSSDNDIYDGQLSIDFDAREEKLEGEQSEQSEKNSECTESVSSKNKYDPEHPRKIDVLFDFVELFIFSLVAVLIFTTFFLRHSVVDGSSMENTLFEGEHLIISDMFYSPQRGDIIVCEDYSTSLRKPLVKRIIGIAGDRIQISERGEVTLNGEALTEDYVYTDGIIYDAPVDIVVPDGEIFVMGDHRNMSTDSREFGTISEDSIIGRVLIRIYPFDKFGAVE